MRTLPTAGAQTHLAHQALVVALHDQIKVAPRIRSGDGRVWPNDGLRSVRWRKRDERERRTLPSAPMGARVTTQEATGRPTTCAEVGECQCFRGGRSRRRVAQRWRLALRARLLRVRESEAVHCCVVRHALNGSQLESTELLRAQGRRRSGSGLGRSRKGRGRAQSAHRQRGGGKQVRPERREPVHGGLEREAWRRSTS